MSKTYNFKIYLSSLLLLAIILLATRAEAANRFWVAAAASNWNNTVNWSTTSGGAGGATVPGNADVAIFDNLGNGNCNINVAVNVNGFQLNGYTGAVSQNANAIVIGATGFSQNSGSFVGGTSTIQINTSTFALAGGSFTATSSSLSIGGVQTTSTIFNHSAGTFAHNNGTVVFNPQIAGCSAGNYTIDVLPTTVFYNVTLAGVAGCGTFPIISTAGGDNIDVANNFTHNDGVFNGLASFKNNLIIGASADGGSGSITADGVGAQTYSVNAAAPRTAHLIVNKSAGSLTPAGGTTDLSLVKFSLLQGDFTAPSGNFKIGGVQTTSTIFTHSAGVFSHNNGTTIIDPQITGCSAGDYTIDVLPITVFYNVTLAGVAGCGNFAIISTAGGDNIDAANNFTHNDGVFNGLASFKNNLIIGASADGGSGSITADGVGVQTYSVNAAAPRTAHLIVNKSAGSLTPAGGTTDLSLIKFSLLQGDFTAPSGNFKIGGVQTTSTIFTHSAGVFSHNNGTTIIDPQITGCSAGDYTIDVLPTSVFYNVTLAGVAGCGNFAIISTAGGDNIDAANNFTHNDGVFNGLASFKNNLIIGASADGGSGSITADGVGAQTYSVNAAAPRTAHLIVNKSAGSLIPAGGTTDLSLIKFSLLQGNFTAPSGNFKIGGVQTTSTIFTHSAGVFSHNNGTTIIDPQITGCSAGDYTIDVLPTTVFYNVTLSGIAGCGILAIISTAIGDNIDASNNFTHNDGVFNGLASFENNLIIGASADGGSGSITADGVGAQTYSVNAAAPRTAHLIVNKSAGSLTPAGGTTDLSLIKFSLLQGNFTAPSGNFEIGGVQTTSTIFTQSGGVFTHNNGTTIIDPQITGCSAGNYTIDVIPSTSFYNVIINGIAGCGIFANITTAVSDTIKAGNNFTHNDGVYNGVATFKNNLVIGSSSDGGVGVLIADGAGAQTYSVAPTAQRTAHLIVNKSAGDLTPAAGTTKLLLSKFTLLQGGFTAPSGNFNIGGVQNSGSIFLQSGGVFSHNNGTTILDPQISGCTSSTYTIDVITTTVFFNVKLAGVAGCGINAVFATAVNDTINASNDFFHNDGVFNGIAEFQKDLYVGASANGGTGTLIATNTAAQTYNVDPAAPRTAHLIVNKTANTLSQGLSTTMLSVTKFSLLQGTFIAPTGDFKIGGVQTTSTIFSQTAGTFDHNSGVAIFDPQITGCSAGTYMINVIASTLFNYVTINGISGCGITPVITTAAGDTLDVLLDLVHNDGAFGGLASTQNNLIINAASDGGTGSFIFGGVGNQNYIVDAAAPRSPNIVNNNGTGIVSASATTNWSVRALTITQGTFEAPSGVLNLSHNFSNSGTFIPNNANVSFAGTINQLILGNTVTTFYDVNVNNAAYVTLLQNCTIDNNLNFTNGRFNINNRRLFLGLNTTVSGVTTARYIQSNGLASGLGVQKEFPAGTANFTFPIGTAARYTPVTYDITANAATGTINIQPVTGKHPSTTAVANTQLNFYWKVLETGFSGLAVTHTYNYIQADVAGTEASYVAGRFVNPLWTPLAGIAGTVNAVANTITLTGVNYLVGDYTAGLPAEFQNTPAVVISASPSLNICSGTNVTFTAVPTNGGATPSYQWQLNGVNVGTSITTYSNAALVDDDVITCLLTSSIPSSFPNPATSNALTMNVTTTVTPAISINALPGSSICSGSSVAFTANISNGGTSPSFQWKKNGVNVGTNSPSYNLAAPVNGDIITCVLTSNAPCRTSNTATSAGVTITINSVVTPTINIVATPPGGICDGTSVTFNANITNGGAFPTYQWTLNGANVGTNSATYTNPALVNGDLVKCALTSNATCATPSVVNSNTITMTVGAVLTPALVINASPSTTNCTGATVTFTPSPTNGGGSPSYEWFLNSVSQGVSPTFISSSINNGDAIYAVMTSSLVCASVPTATSATLTMTVTPSVLPTISISTSQVSVCSGLVFSSIIANGGGSPGYQWKKNGTDLIGETNSTYNGSGLSIGDLITCELTSNATCASPMIVLSNSIAVSLTAPLTTWLGGSDDSWINLSNWSNGIPYNNLDVVIPSGTTFSPLISGVAETFNLTIDVGATLTIAASNFIEIYGNFSNNGTFTANTSEVKFRACGGTGAVAHNITTSNGSTTTFYDLTLDDLAGATLTTDANLIGALTLTNGTFTNSSNVFNFKSTSSATARIAPVAATANYVGNITMERFAPGGATGWAQLGTPIQGATLADWYDNFPMTGFTGVYNGASMNGFVSVWTYNESIAGLFDAAGSYVAATNVTNSLTVGKGFWIYLGNYGAQGGSSTNTTDITVDVTGQPYIGNFNFNPSYTNSGTPDADGYNLVANPYPSAIDWTSASWTKTNMNDALYIYQADNGQYASFVNGIGINGGSRYIASSQGFYVQANAASPVLQITENAKSSANPVLIRESDPSNVLRLVVSGNDLQDETVIHLNEGASKQFDGSYDAYKFFSNYPLNPSISTVGNNNKDFSINSLPFEAKTISIPVRVTVGISGMHTLSWKGLERFPQGSCIVLEDLENGIKTDLSSSSEYYFTMASGFVAPRFIIHVTTPLQKNVAAATCNNTNDGSIVLHNPFNSICQVEVSNTTTNTMVYSATFSETNYTIGNLAAGTYKISYPNLSLCGDITETVVIVPETTVGAAITVTTTNVFTNAPIKFNTEQVQGTTSTWDFGDGYSTTGESEVTHQYANEGEYTVTVTNSKGNCSETQSLLMQVSGNPINGHSAMDIQMINGSYYAVFYFDKTTKANITIVNALGAQVQGIKTFEGKNGNVKLDLTTLSEGVYLVTLTDGINTITKKIVK